MSNIQKNFKTKRSLKVGCFADGLVPSYEEQAAQLEAQSLADAKAKLIPAQKPGLMQRVFGSKPAAPAPAPTPVAAPAPTIGGVADAIRERGQAVRTIANYAHGKVPTHVGPGIVDGPGGPREDKVPAMLSDEEAVLPAKTVQAMGGPEVVANLIEETTGKAPSRTLSKGKFEGGFTGWAKDVAGKASGAASSTLNSAKNMISGHGSGVPGIEVGNASMDDFQRAQTNVTRDAINKAASGRTWTGGTPGGIGSMPVGEAAGRVVDAAKDSRLLRTAGKAAGWGGVGLAALQSAGNISAVASDPDAGKWDVAGQVFGEIGKGAATAAGAMGGGAPGAVAGYTAADTALKHTPYFNSGDVSRYARLPSQAALNKPISEDEIKQATVGPDGMVDEARYARGLKARAARTAPVATAAPGQPAEMSDAQRQVQNAATLAAFDAQPKRTISDAMVGVLDRGVNTATPEVDSNALIRKHGHAAREMIAHQLARTDRDITVRGQDMQAGTMMRGQDLTHESSMYGHNIAGANHRMNLQWKGIEAQADKNAKLMEALFGPALDGDKKPNPERQAAEKDLAATMAKFGVQHPGMLDDRMMQHWLTTRRMAERARPGWTERAAGWAGLGNGKPAVDYSSSYDAMGGAKWNPAAAGGGAWELNGKPFNTYSTTLAGTGIGPFNPAADGDAMQLMQKAREEQLKKQRTIKTDGAR